MKNTITARACSAAVALALFAGVAAGEEPATASNAGSGFRAYIDPVTGKLRQATAAERAAEARAAAAERKAHPKRVPKLMKRADGIVYAVDEDGYFAEDAVATVGPDGKVVYSFTSEGQPTTTMTPAVSAEEK